MIARLQSNVTKMSYHENKILPATPGPQEQRRATQEKFSFEACVMLLEQEVEQLRLRNKELTQELHRKNQNLEALEQRANHHDEDLRQRDELVGELADLIGNKFQRYKEILGTTEANADRSAIIHIYSQL
jgi:predicted NACHT family NTPase